MAVNRDKPDRWKKDILASVDMYNEWFVSFAPDAFRTARGHTAMRVEETLMATDNLRDIRPEILKTDPGVLPTLRMSTCPPLARDRLIGLAGVPKGLVDQMENDGRVPSRMSAGVLDVELRKLIAVIVKLADPDIFTWLADARAPTETELRRAATVVADRLCGATANPIIRNAQEDRQLRAIQNWLEGRGYRHLPSGEGMTSDKMPVGTFAFRLNVPVRQETDSDKVAKIPVDVVIMPRAAREGDFPLLIEAKSAGDYTTVNKRRKEEATKVRQLRRTYGDRVTYVLFLCGYFDSGYLGYEAAEGIDWVWEHRLDDLTEFGL
jgi:hypothetical protein